MKMGSVYSPCRLLWRAVPRRIAAASGWEKYRDADEGRWTRFVYIRLVKIGFASVKSVLWSGGWFSEQLGFVKLSESFVCFNNVTWYDSFIHIGPLFRRLIYWFTDIFYPLGLNEDSHQTHSHPDALKGIDDGPDDGEDFSDRRNSDRIFSRNLSSSFVEERVAYIHSEGKGERGVCEINAW